MTDVAGAQGFIDPAGPIRDLKARVVAENAARGLTVVKFGYDPSPDGVAPDEIELVLTASAATVATPVDQLASDAAFDKIVAASRSHDDAEAAAEAIADLRRRVLDGGDLLDDPEDP
jgi:hypothetical protein